VWLISEGLNEGEMGNFKMGLDKLERKDGDASAQ
jgi:hypothetical protein